MTLNSQIKSVLEAYPETKHSRSQFFWQYGIAHFGFNPILGAITKENFLGFIKNFNAIDREMRRILKEEGYSLSPQEEILRREKEIEYQEAYKPKV